MRPHLDTLHQAHSRDIPLITKNTGKRVAPNGATWFHDFEGGNYADYDVTRVCWNDGPRIGEEMPRCMLPQGHDGKHGADESFGDERW